MNEIFLAKIRINNKDSLVFTNGILYSLVESSFPKIKNFTSFLSIKANELSISEKILKNKLPEDVQYLDLIEDQHIFATGCTYKWSPEQLASTTDNDVYKMLYQSERSMFFYKGNKLNCAKNFESIGVRADAKITIPEAELVAVFNYAGDIVGYTLGNDVTALDLEKQNPLYQAQAKFYKGSAALLPLVKLGSVFPRTNLRCSVFREGKSIVETTYNTQNFNRDTEEILKQLRRSELNPSGGFLFLGCGIPYPIEFGLIQDDLVKIESDIFPLSLQNTCAKIGVS